MATILIVEDDHDEVVLLKRALKRAGLDMPTEVVVDGGAAIEYLERSRPGGSGTPAWPILILLDLNLPRVSGFDVLRWARGRQGVRRLPIVVLTTSDDPTDIANAYDLGANSYVVKPRGFAQLDEAARRFREYWLELNAAPPQPRDDMPR